MPAGDEQQFCVACAPFVPQREKLIVLSPTEHGALKVQRKASGILASTERDDEHYSGAETILPKKKTMVLTFVFLPLSVI